MGISALLRKPLLPQRGAAATERLQQGKRGWLQARRSVAPR